MPHRPKEPRLRTNYESGENIALVGAMTRAEAHLYTGSAAQTNSNDMKTGVGSSRMWSNSAGGGISSPVPPSRPPSHSTSSSPSGRLHTASSNPSPTKAPSASSMATTPSKRESSGHENGHAEDDLVVVDKDLDLKQNPLPSSTTAATSITPAGSIVDVIPSAADTYWPNRDYEADQANSDIVPSRGWSPSFTDFVNHKRKIISFNIGGRIFATSRETIANDEFCMLNVMLKHEPSMSSTRDESGAIFIDRDPTYFQYVLNYLRNGIVDLPPEKFKLNAILREAEFYQINGLYTAVQN